MKKYLLIVLCCIFLVGLVGCNGKSVKDKRIVGTWESSMGARHVFKENGTVNWFSEGTWWDYEAEDGQLVVTFGKFGNEGYSYEFVYGATEEGEFVEYLVLDGNYYKKVSD